MKHAHLTTHAERAIRLEHANFGVPCLKVVEAPAHEILQPLTIVSIHNAAPCTGPGMDRLIRAVAAFNAIMDEAETEEPAEQIGVAA